MQMGLGVKAASYNISKVFLAEQQLSMQTHSASMVAQTSADLFTQHRLVQTYSASTILVPTVQ